MDFVEVDGSRGEGGGQTLRTALAFSVVLGKPVRVSKVRAGRPVPGLRRQHVSAAKVISEVFGGTLEGATEGSSQVSYAPGDGGKAGRVSIDMGTAASVTLVLQAVVPAAAVTGLKLELRLTGGTDVPWSPTLDYFGTVVRAAYARAGVAFALEASRRGYYPRGGGRIMAVVEPGGPPKGIEQTSPPQGSAPEVTSRCALLPKHVAERQLAAAVSYLRRAGVGVSNSSASLEEADSPGSSICLSEIGEGVARGSDAIGSRGKTAEAVGVDAASRYIATLRSGANFDENVTDMLVPVLSLAGVPSRLRVPRVTPHTQTVMDLATQFTGCDFAVEGGGSSVVLEVRPMRHNL